MRIKSFGSTLPDRQRGRSIQIQVDGKAIEAL